MTEDMLALLNRTLKGLLPYQYWDWTGKVVYPYWVGEYVEGGFHAEDGSGEATFLVTGTTIETVHPLEQGKTVLRNAFPPVAGEGFCTEEGNRFLVFYDKAVMIPTDQNDIRRIQVQLAVYFWKTGGKV